MNKEKEAVKLFSSNLDRLLSGQRVPTAAGLDENVTIALNFAEKMLTLRCSPSAEYSKQLKARLLQKLAQQEIVKSGSKINWINRFISQPVWQATAIILILAVLTVAVWKAGVFQIGVPSTTTTTGTTTTGGTTITTTVTVTGAPISAQGSTDRTVYNSGQPVNIDITLTNITSQPIEIEKYPPIISLMQTETQKPVYTFISNETTKLTLSPGEKADYKYTWYQIDQNEKLVPAGNYYIELEDINPQGNTIKLNLSQPVSFNISAQ